MSLNSSLLDVPLKETIGDKNVTYVFHKDKHAKILLENLAEMQAQGGLLTDVTLCTRAKDHEEKFHSMLLAACSPAVKRVLVWRDAKGTKGCMALQELTKEILECFRKFIYKSEVIVDENILDDLNNFAVKYDIDVLAGMCGKVKDQEGRNPMRFVFDDQEDVLSELFSMFLEKELTTTVLEDRKGNTQFAVHGPLIAAASPVLQEALLQGSSAREKEKLRLDIPPVVLGDLIGYIYSAKVTLQRENAVGLLRAACTYEMPALAKVCCDWLIQRLNTYDVAGILCLARELDSAYTENLEEESKRYIIANFSKLSVDEEFDALGYEDLKEIIQNDRLDIEAEEDVFRVVVKWMEHDEETRLPHLSELLSCVRLEQTSEEFLQEVEQDPRIARSSRCLQLIEEARQKLLAAEDQSEANSVTTEDEGFQDVESLDDTSLSRHSEETLLADTDGLSTASYRGAAKQDSLRDSYPRDSHHSDSYSRDNYQPEYEPDSYSRDSYQHDSYPRDSHHSDSYSLASNQPESYSRDTYQPDRFSSVNYPCDSFWSDQYPSNSSSCASYHTDRYRTKKPDKKLDGQADMRFKENRELYLEKGFNVNGTPDKRFRENRAKFTPPVKKDGSPDMRYKVNKELFGRKDASAPVYRPRLNKDGTPDMRCKANKEAFSSPRSTTSSVYTSVSRTPSVGTRFPWELPLSSGYIGGPLKNDGTPDMRYTVNKQRYGANSAAASVSRGPLKKNGTPDMRYAVNKQSHNPTPSSTKARGPLKKNGTPDMRFKANRR
ncbi:uncharacterized protein LOC144628589 [Oculina patagonica]